MYKKKKNNNRGTVSFLYYANCANSSVILLLNKLNCVFETIDVFSQCHVTQHFGNQKGSVTLRSVSIHAEQGSLSITQVHKRFAESCTPVCGR